MPTRNMICPRCKGAGRVNIRSKRKPNMTDGQMKAWLYAQARIVEGKLDTPCWIWTGGTQYQGYGQVQWKGKSRMVHRVAYELWYGPIDDDLVVRHMGDCHKGCYRPTHLHADTQLANVREAMELGTFRATVLKPK